MMERGMTKTADAIIIAAGVYIYYREKVKGQMIATDTPTVNR